MGVFVQLKTSDLSNTRGRAVIEVPPSYREVSTMAACVLSQLFIFFSSRCYIARRIDATRPSLRETVSLLSVFCIQFKISLEDFKAKINTKKL